MMRRNTTHTIYKHKQPLSTYFGRGLCFASIAILLLAIPAEMVMPVSADQYDNEINALQQQINQYQSQANVLNAQAQTLQNAVNALQDQISAVQTQIQLSQATYDQLTQQIADTQNRIQKDKNVLGDTLADLYVDGKTSTLEMLASSKNISDYLDKTQYQDSIRNQLTTTITQIQTLQQQLKDKQAQVKVVLDREDAQKAQLAAQQSQQATLLAQTQGQEAAYQQLVSSAQQQQQQAAAAQRAYYASLVSRGGGASSGVSGSFQWQDLSPSNGAGGCSGGYAYCQSQDSIVDPWGLYNRECVSYVAWALANRFHKYVGNFSGHGNAYEWPSSAPTYSGAIRVYPNANDSNIQVGDAVILPASGSFSPIGHAMIVESVYSNGWIHVSQFNFYGTGQYSTMDIKDTGVIFLQFQSQ